jgi:hypothetical protein
MPKILRQIQLKQIFLGLSKGFNVLEAPSPIYLGIEKCRKHPSQAFLKTLYEVEGLSSFQFSLSLSLSLSGHFSSPVIGRHRSVWCSQTTRGFVQSKSPAGLSVYKCTKAGINSPVTVPSKVCVPQVGTKTLE